MVAQVAIALVLLVGAGLLVRSLWNLQAVQHRHGDRRSVLTLRVWLPQPNDPQAGPYFEHAKRVVLIRGVSSGSPRRARSSTRG